MEASLCITEGLHHHIKIIFKLYVELFGWELYRISSHGPLLELSHLTSTRILIVALPFKFPFKLVFDVHYLVKC